jgi:hypothetical protein
MGLYNFMPKFVDLILAGKKTHTIRAIRVHPDEPGNTLHLYTGLRTKKAKLLMRARCLAVQRIKISADTVSRREGITCNVWIDGIWLTLDERESLAKRDGFSNFQEMMNFWSGRLPFIGHIIHWKYDLQKS